MTMSGAQKTLVGGPVDCFRWRILASMDLLNILSVSINRRCLDSHARWGGKWSPEVLVCGLRVLSRRGTGESLTTQTWRT